MALTSAEVNEIYNFLTPGAGSGSFIHNNGTGNTATGIDGIALGDGCSASGHNSVCFGVGTTASGENSIAMGYNSIASGSRSVAISNGSTASGIGSFAAGENSEAIGEDSAVFGVFCIAGESESFVHGVSCQAWGTAAHAEGEATTANGNNSHSEGVNTTANGVASHAEGDSCGTEGVASKAYGKGAVAFFDYSTAFASGGFGQRSEHMLNNRTTTNAATVLYIDYSDNTKELDAASAGTNIFWDFEARMIAVDDGTGGSGVANAVRAITLKGTFSKAAGIIGTPIEIYNDGSASTSTWTFVPSASGTKLRFTVTGQANKNINWTCYVILVQVSY